MKDVVVKYCGHTVGSGIISINDKKVYFTNYYKLLSEFYNELLSSNLSPFELLKEWIESLRKDEIIEIKNICENKLNKDKPIESKNFSDKWDGYTIKTKRPSENGR